MKALPSTPLVKVDLSALCRNFRRISAATPKAKPAAVVKCNAYGLGLVPVARALALHEQCETFFVAFTKTGIALRSALSSVAPDAKIYVFNGPSANEIDDFKIHRLTPVLNTVEQTSLWASSCPNATAALHIDTGMNRLGLAVTDMAAINQIDNLSIELVMSHFACASTPRSPMLAQQQSAFDTITKMFPGAKTSLASTGGALIDDAFGYDITRLGVGLYGASPFADAHDQIEPVAQLLAPVFQIRAVKAGQSAGYNATHIFKEDATLATIAIGYGDGFPRAGSNRAHVWLGGARCPMVGIISMDTIIVDITAAPAPIQVGDWAELYGTQLLIEEAASTCNTIAYELLTGLGERAERRYFWENAPADASLTG